MNELTSEEIDYLKKMVSDISSLRTSLKNWLEDHNHDGIKSQKIKDLSLISFINDAEILTNKRIKKRVDVQTSTASITPEISSYDIFVRTAQSSALVINNHSSSTPDDGDIILFEILSDATPRAITYGDKYVAKAGVSLPSTTVSSKNLTMLFIWRADLSQWNLLASGQE